MINPENKKKKKELDQTKAYQFLIFTLVGFDYFFISNFFYDYVLFYMLQLCL